MPKFSVQALKFAEPLRGVKVRYPIGPEKMKPAIIDSMALTAGLTIKDVSMGKPGFVNCFVYDAFEGKEYRGGATAAFDPEAIESTVKMSDDFDEFWQTACAEAVKMPLDARMTLMPDQCITTVSWNQSNVAAVRIEIIGVNLILAP